MTSRVPPVSIAATGHAEPAGLEQHAAQRLGAVRRKDEQRRVRDVRQRRGTIEPAGEADVEAAAAGRVLERGAIRTVADDDQRPRSFAASGRRHQVLHALVEGELADVDRVRAGDPGERRAGGAAPRASSVATSTGLGITSTRRPASAGARATRSRAITALTATMASASARRPAFQRRLARM